MKVDVMDGVCSTLG